MFVLKHVTTLLTLWVIVGCGDAIATVVDYPPQTSTDSASDSENKLGADSDSTGTDTADTDNDSSATLPSFIVGADISWVDEQEDLGVVFAENGIQEDILTLMKRHGFNFIRLRIFHDPGQPDGYQYAFEDKAEPYCDLAHTLEMARRIKEQDMGLCLNFHYSDTWADPANQVIPAAWADHTFEDLVEDIYNYTHDVLGAFRAAGILPQMVQLGNEITTGILHPIGQVDNPYNWDQFAALINSACAAVRDVNPDILIVLHLDKGDSNDNTVQWMDEMLSRNVQFDVLGQSTYTAWQGEPAQWRENFELLTSQYPNHSFLIAEYGDNYSEVNQIMRDTPRGLGTFLWEPTRAGEWGQGLFDISEIPGEATPKETITIFDELAATITSK